MSRKRWIPVTPPIVMAVLWAVSGCASIAPAGGPAEPREPSSLEQAEVDSIATAALAGGRAAGMSIAVARGGRVVARGAYGSADLELDVPTPPEAVYEIGSVTKQFTAAAVLQLMERGKIDLDADLTTYLPDYPTGGRTVPVHRLLDHTSGIRGYTEIPEFGLLSIRHVPRDTLVAAFASRPFDFEPGEAAVYNNSAYYLLGLIIEEVTGLDYAEYVERHLFEPAEMTRSSYCSETAITPGKVRGYSWGSEGLRHKDFLVHDHPFAAGSLCSTVDDLVAWTTALHSGRILGPDAYARMIAGGTLNDGTRLRYAGGLALSDVAGHPAIHHGGGIPGFLSHLAHLPDQDMTIAVLVNTTGPVGPAGITAEIVDALLGTRVPEPRPLRGDPSVYVGEYEGVGRGGTMRVTVSEETGGLAIRIGSGGPQPLIHLGDGTFARETARFIFEEEDGRAVRLRADLGGSYIFLHRRP